MLHHHINLQGRLSVLRLQVNSISMSGKTQAEVVKMLRNTPQGSLVSLIVSRQEEVDDRFSVPREMVSDDVSSLFFSPLFTVAPHLNTAKFYCSIAFLPHFIFPLCLTIFYSIMC